MHTYRQINISIPDIFIKDLNLNIGLLIDMRVSSDRNFSAKKFEKLMKYTYHQIVISRM